MKVPFLYLIALFLLVGCDGAPVYSVYMEGEAKRLLREACSLLKQAEEIEKTDYIKAYDSYRKAFESLETIVEQYRSSRLAQDLIDGEIRVFRYRFDELRDLVLPYVKERAEAVSNPLACSLFLAKRIRHPRHRASILSDIASKCARIGQKDVTYRILSDLLRRAESTRNPEYITYIICPHIEADMLDSLINIALSAETPFAREENLEYVSVCYTYAKHYDEAVKVAMMMKSPSRRAEALLDVVKDCRSEGYKEKVREILDKVVQMLVEDPDPTLLDWKLPSIIREYLKNGDYELALQKIRGIEDAQTAFSGIGEILIWCKKKQQKGILKRLLTEALEIVNRMEKDERGSKLVSLSFLCDGMVTNEKIKEWLDEAVLIARGSENIWHKNYVFANAGFQYAKLGDVEKALEMIEMAEALPPHRNRNVSWVIEMVCEGLTYSGHFKTAMRLLKTIDEEWERVCALWDLVRALIKVGDTANALAAARMVREGRDEVLRTLVEKCLEKGELKRALEAVKMINDRGDRDWSLYLIARKYVELREFDKALEIADRVSCPWEDEIYEAVAVGFAKIGRYDEAVDVAKKAGWRDDDDILEKVCYICAKSGNYERAFEIADMITEDGRFVKSDALAAIARASMERGDYDKTIEFATKGGKGVYVLCELSRMYMKNGQFQKALKVAETAETCLLKDYLLAEISLQFEKKGLIEEAIEIAEGITKDRRGKLFAFARLLDKCLETGLKVRAFELVTRIVSEIGEGEFEPLYLTFLSQTQRAFSLMDEDRKERIRRLLHRVMDEFFTTRAKKRELWNRIYGRRTVR